MNKKMVLMLFFLLINSAYATHKKNNKNIVPDTWDLRDQLFNGTCVVCRKKDIVESVSTTWGTTSILSHKKCTDTISDIKENVLYTIERSMPDSADERNRNIFLNNTCKATVLFFYREILCQLSKYGIKTIADYNDKISKEALRAQMLKAATKAIGKNIRN